LWQIRGEILLKVLYIATSFPEPNKGATIYTDLAEALHEAGHEITVAVSEQARNKKHTEMKKERGFDVLRIVTGNYYDVGFIEKGITTLKIPILMKKGIKEYLGDRKFDFILFEAPPVTNAGLVAWAKKQFSCPSYLMLKDIFPQNAIDLGIIKENGFIHRYFKSKERKLLQTADFIGCMSNANKAYVLDHNSWIDSSKIEIFPNTKKITNDIKVNTFPIRERFGIPKESCVFLFGGNMGRPQYIDLLCEVIKGCKNENEMYFLFVGRGTDRYKLEQTIKENQIDNALVIENLPRIEYEQITKECDVGLIVLDPRFTIPNYPSRILSYMEYGKPVLAATDKVTDLKELIEEAECGEWVWSGDVKAFINKAKEMVKSEKLKIMGDNGRKYLEEKFNIKYSVEILESHFKK
jgi:glycosyltransferase involved in cell wall biosynthesis